MEDVEKTPYQTLAKAVDNMSAVLSDNQKLNQALLQEGVLRYENLMHEGQHHFESLSHDGHVRYEKLMAEIKKREDEIRQENKRNHEKESIRQRFDAYIITVISVLSICASIIVSNYWDLREKQIDLKRVELMQRSNQESVIQNRIQYLQSQIDHRFALRDQLMDAMVKMRGIRDIGQKQCKAGQYDGTNPENYQEKLFATSYDLVGACYKIIGIFNDEIKQETLHFLSISSADNGNICEKNATTDKELRPLQVKIDNQIISLIEGLEQQKNMLMVKLNSKTQENFGGQYVEKPPLKNSN